MTIECNTQSSITLSACDQEKKQLENKIRKQVITEWKCHSSKCQFPKRIYKRVKCCMEYDFCHQIIDRLKIIQNCNREEIKQIKVFIDKELEKRKKECGQYGYKSKKCQTLKTGFSSECREKYIVLWNQIFNQLSKEWNCDLENITVCHLPQDMVKGVDCCSSYDAIDRFSNKFKSNKECYHKMLTIVKDSNDVWLQERQQFCNEFGYHSEKCAQLKESIYLKCKEKIVVLMNKNRVKVMKEWNCYPNCFHSKHIMEALKCCPYYEVFDRNMIVFKDIKQCDQTLLSMIRDTAQENLNVMKNICSEYGYNSKKCANLKVQANSNPNPTVGSNSASNKQIAYKFINCLMTCVLIGLHLKIKFC